MMIWVLLQGLLRGDLGFKQELIVAAYYSIAQEYLRWRRLHLLSH